MNLYVYARKSIMSCLHVGMTWRRHIEFKIHFTLNKHEKKFVHDS